MLAGRRPAAAFAAMRIFLVNDYGTRAGGTEMIVFGLRDALRARGHDMRVFTSSARAGGDDSLAGRFEHVYDDALAALGGRA